MKHEQRLLVIHRCPGGLWLALVYRGPGRVEHLLAAPGGLESILNTVRQARFYEELRSAWPPEAARLLGLEPLEPSRYLGPCTDGLRMLLETACRSLEALTQHNPGPSGGEEEPGENSGRRPLAEEEPGEQRGPIGLEESHAGDRRGG